MPSMKIELNKSKKCFEKYDKLIHKRKNQKCVERTDFLGKSVNLFRILEVNDNLAPFGICKAPFNDFKNLAHFKGRTIVFNKDDQIF